MMIARELHDAMVLLEVWPAFQDALSRLASPEGVPSMIASIQAQARANRKRLARASHPDLGGTLEQMQALNGALDLVDGLRVSLPQVPIRTTVHIRWATATTTPGFGRW